MSEVTRTVLIGGPPISVDDRDVLALLTEILEVLKEVRDDQREMM